MVAVSDERELMNDVVPVPTSARKELPEDAALVGAGVELDLEEARVVLTVLSRVIARGHSATRHKVHQMVSGLVAACTLERERDGLVEPAAHPELSMFGWPNGSTAFRRLGIDHAMLESYWVGARTRSADACLPLAWVLAFCPARLWPAVWTFICWGPEKAGLMMEEAAIELAGTSINRGSRRRAAGSALAAGTIRTRLNGVWQLMDELVWLCARLAWEDGPPLPCDLLAAWTHKPKRPDLDACGAKEARLDVAGPPLDECAARLRELAADVEAAPKANRYFRLRRLVICALLCLYGIRVDALRRLRVEDYQPDFVFRDGVRGPALRLYPGKTRAEDEAYYLPVPAELAGWLEEWIAYLGHRVGERDLPLFPGTRPRQGRRGGFMDSTGMYTFIAGKPNGNASGSLALLPRNGNPYIGWHPHAFRHSAYQGARRAGTMAKKDSPEAFATVEPDDFARAVVGHALIRTTGDRYRDLDQQRLARAAVEEAWQFLLGGGTRRGPDLEAVRQARARERELEAERQAYMAELRILEEEQQRLLARSERSRGDALHQLSFRSNAVQQKSRVLSHEIATLHDKLQAARQEVERALSEEVPYPPDMSREDHERALQLALEEKPAESASNGPPLADELTVADAAELFNATVQSINRWYNQRPPTSRALPWTHGRKAWHIYSKRHKRLRVDAINHNALTPQQQVRLNELRRKRAAANVQKKSANPQGRT